MKNAKIIALLLAALTLFSAMSLTIGASYYGTKEANGCKLLASYSTIDDDGDVVEKTEWGYDAEGRIISETEYEQGISGLRPASRYLFTYDAKGNETSAAYETYDREGQTWIPENKTVRDFDANGRQTLEEYSETSGDATVVKKRTEWVYDGKTAVETKSEYSKAAGTLVPEEGCDYTFLDESCEKVTEEIQYNYNTEQEKTFTYKDEYTYDEKGNKTSEKEFGHGSGDWKELRRVEYKYNANGDVIERTESVVPWGGTELTPDIRAVYSFPSDGSVELIYYSYNTETSEWDISHRQTWKEFTDFPVLGQAAFNIFSGSSYIQSLNADYNWDAAKEDYYVSYYTTVSLSDDKLTAEYVVCGWDYSKWEKYDEMKSVVTYTDNTYNEAIYKSYMYDSGSSAWKEDESMRQRVTTERDSFGNLTSLMRYGYDLEKQEWELISGEAYTYTDSLYHSQTTKKVEATNSTCDTHGHKEYYTCDCGTVAYLDENGETKIDDLETWLAGDGSIAFAAHEYENGVCKICGENEPEPDKGGLSTGALIAIIICAIVVLGGAGAAVYFFVIKKKKAA